MDDQPDLATQAKANPQTPSHTTPKEAAELVPAVQAILDHLRSPGGARGAFVGRDLPGSAGDGLARRRAAWALGVLALGAVMVGAIMVFWFGSSSDPHQDAGLPATGGSTTPAKHSAAATPAHSSPRPSASKSGRTAAASCPTSAPCVLPGDAGQAVAAINAYRASHHRPSVPGRVSSAAQSCALHSGNEGPCPSSYFWEPVATPDGAAAIAKIAASGDGSGWLLDPQARSFAVGWAYAPGAAGAAGQVEVAAVKIDESG